MADESKVYPHTGAHKWLTLSPRDIRVNDRLHPAGILIKEFQIMRLD